MAYTLIATQTLLNPTATVTFNGIPQGFKDLVLEVVMPNSSGMFITGIFNSDTGTNYSRTYLIGQGISTASSRQSNMSSMGFDSSSNSPKSGEVLLINVQSYSNASVYKTIISRESISNDYVGAHVNLWRNTAAVTTFQLIGNSANIPIGSTFKLWGVS